MFDNNLEVFFLSKLELALELILVAQIVYIVHCTTNTYFRNLWK